MKPLDDVSIFDELRRFTTGAMSIDERARFEAEMSRDPELAHLATNFRAAWNLTERALRPNVVSRTQFDDIAQRVDLASQSTVWRRRVAAAIIVLALAGVGWIAWRGALSSADDTVVLRAIPWPVEVSELPEITALPAGLTNWSPVADGQIRWLESMDEARVISAAVGRPMFVYGYFEDCPICQGFERDEFKDPGVLALVDQAVPVRIDLMKLAEADARAIYARRYPLLEMQNERGEILYTFPGTFAEVDMRAELASELAELPRPDWKLVHDLAGTYTKARVAETNGRFAEATGGFADLATNRELPKFAEAGRAGITRLAALAGKSIEDARARAAQDSVVALAQFESEVQRFAGTQYSSDLDAVMRAWREFGHFPKLAVRQ